MDSNLNEQLKKIGCLNAESCLCNQYIQQASFSSQNSFYTTNKIRPEYQNSSFHVKKNVSSFEKSEKSSIPFSLHDTRCNEKECYNGKQFFDSSSSKYHSEAPYNSTSLSTKFCKNFKSSSIDFQSDGKSELNGLIDFSPKENLHEQPPSNLSKLSEYCDPIKGTGGINQQSTQEYHAEKDFINGDEQRKHLSIFLQDDNDNPNSARGGRWRWKSYATEMLSSAVDVDFDEGNRKSSMTAYAQRLFMLKRWRKMDMTIQKELMNFGSDRLASQMNQQTSEVEDEELNETCKTDCHKNEDFENDYNNAKDIFEKKLNKKQRYVIEFQIHEAKQYYKMFGEWIEKDWITNEIERKMWERAKVECMSHSESKDKIDQNENSEQLESTLEEMKDAFLNAVEKGLEEQELDKIRVKIEMEEKKLNKQLKMKEMSDLERFKQLSCKSREKHEESRKSEESDIKSLGQQLNEIDIPFEKGTNISSRHSDSFVEDLHVPKTAEFELDESESCFDEEMIDDTKSFSDDPNISFGCSENFTSFRLPFSNDAYGLFNCLGERNTNSDGKQHKKYTSNSLLHSFHDFSVYPFLNRKEDFSIRNSETGPSDNHLTTFQLKECQKHNFFSFSDLSAANEDEHLPFRVLRTEDRAKVDAAQVRAGVVDVNERRLRYEDKIFNSKRRNIRRGKMYKMLNEVHNNSVLVIPFIFSSKRMSKKKERYRVEKMK